MRNRMWNHHCGWVLAWKKKGNNRCKIWKQCIGRGGFERGMRCCTFLAHCIQSSDCESQPLVCIKPLATYTCTVAPPCLVSNHTWNEAAVQEDVIPRGFQPDKVASSTIHVNPLLLFEGVGCNRNNNTNHHRHLPDSCLGNTPSIQNHHYGLCFFRYN